MFLGFYSNRNIKTQHMLSKTTEVFLLIVTCYSECVCVHVRACTCASVHTGNLSASELLGCFSK